MSKFAIRVDNLCKRYPSAPLRTCPSAWAAPHQDMPFGSAPFDSAQDTQDASHRPQGGGARYDGRGVDGVCEAADARRGPPW